MFVQVSIPEQTSYFEAVISRLLTDTPYFTIPTFVPITAVITFDWRKNRADPCDTESIS